MLSHLKIPILEGVMLSTGFAYNILSVKEIEVTRSFLDLGKEVIKCSMEHYENCVTRELIETILKNCKCLPLSINIPSIEKVQAQMYFRRVKILIVDKYYFLFSRQECAHLRNWNVQEMLPYRMSVPNVSANAVESV